MTLLVNKTTYNDFVSWQRELDLSEEIRGGKHDDFLEEHLTDRSKLIRETSLSRLTLLGRIK